MNGKRHGLGLFYYSNGEMFVGDWKEDQKHGLGIHTDKFGEKTEKRYIKNLKPKEYEQRINQ